MSHPTFNNNSILGPNTALNCEWESWGSWHSPNGNENEDRCACDKSKIE